MSLRKRLLLFASLLALLAALASWAILQQASSGIVEQWGERLLEAQLRHDMSFFSQLLETESIRLEQISDTETLQQWLLSSPKAALKDPALSNQLKALPKATVLSIWLLNPEKYYNLSPSHVPSSTEIMWTEQTTTAALSTTQAVAASHSLGQRSIQLSSDSAFGQPLLSLQIPLSRQETRLGYIRLDLPLTQLLPQSPETTEAGMLRLLTDRQGQVLLLERAETTPAGPLKTLDELIDRPRDRQRIESLLHQLVTQPASETLQTLNATISLKGRRHLVSAAYSPQSGLFELMLQDLNCLLPFERLLPLGAMLLCILLGVVLLLHALLCHLLLNPLAALEKAMGRIQEGNGLDSTQLPAEHTPEVGSLTRRLASIAAKLRTATEQPQAESRVLQRAEALERLIRIDPLTELLNRRGMSEQLEKELERARRHQYGLAILWMDVDHFKNINDNLGHLQGDQALQTVSNALHQCLRSYDHAARWGGDEFLVLLSPCTEQALQTIGERIRQQIAQSEACQCPLTVSIGAYMAQGNSLEQSLEWLLDCADHALYQAKQAGRNCLRIYSESSQSS